jgi:branched-chain amino acid transport system ATP-binding protein
MAKSWQLETKELTKDFGGLRAVNRLDFGIGHQEILGLIGPNGSGKSTSINLIAGFYKPSSGQIFYKGQRIGGLPPWKIARLGIVRTFQHTHLFPLFPTVENLVLGRHVREKTGILDSVFLRGKVNSERKNSEAKAMEMLQATGLAEYALRPAASLPPGAQRILAIAMVLSTNPELLLLDEPAAGLSAEESARLVSFIRELRDRGLSVMIVDHHMKMIMNICDRLVVIDHGTKIAEGRPQEVAVNEQVIEAYLGHAKVS